MPDRIAYSAAVVDLSRRFRQSTAIVGSPALAAETIVCQVVITDDLVIATGIVLEGWVAYTVGTSGTNGTLRIRQTNVAGSIIASSGGLTQAAASLQAPAVQGIDLAAVLPNQTYVLTLQITAGAAASTVTATQLIATVI
jgi:hypothetical protein